MSAQDFQEQLRTSPNYPGCYLFRDTDGQVLYVGKALNIRRRVQVYRREGADGRSRFSDLLNLADAAEFFVTDNEREAILLEDKLVKLHQPPLNILLKDDKSFLLLNIDTSKAWPRLSLARKKRVGRGMFFGPYPSASSARRAKRLLMRAFGLRDCSDHTLNNRARACLKFDIGMCLGPCVNAVTADEYNDAVSQSQRVLNGEVAGRIKLERKKMHQASERLDYEVALRSRDRAIALEALSTPQKVRLSGDLDFDVIAIDVRGFFAILQYRDGDWVHSIKGQLAVVEEHEDAISALLSAAYRGANADIPKQILVQRLPEDHAQICEWLSSKADLKIKILAPARGEKRALVRMAERNARSQRGETSGATWQVVAQRISELTNLPIPAVVDCIDISHLQGEQRVASKVRFVEGRPERSQYRRYLVGGGRGNDDYQAMREVVGRVLDRRPQEGIADLIILDGGALQLGAGLEVCELKGQQVPLVALAKARKGRGPIAAEERLFVPGQDAASVLQRGAPERLFFERIRDEAHRFAISYHRRLRENLRLVLEDVPGVGPAKRKRLLDWAAGNLDSLRDSPPVELTAIDGIDLDLAEKIQVHLRNTLP